MERNPPRPMTQLDEIVTSNTLYMMKCLLPLLPRDTQRILAIMVKYRELTGTLSWFYGIPNTGGGANMLDKIKGFMGEEDLKKLDHMFSLINAMSFMNMNPEDMDLSRFFDDAERKEFRTYSEIFDDILK